jgi:quercetin dioxygenase-like cupin family protein
MKYTRRDLPILASALLASSAARAAKGDRLKTAVINRDDVTATKSNQASQRKYFDGVNHEGMPVECHESELPPGEAPHPPHKHVHEEMIVVLQGTMEVTVEGTATKRITSGGLAYVNSNELHGWKNVGNDRARYLILALGHD